MRTSRLASTVAASVVIVLAVTDLGWTSPLRHAQGPTSPQPSGQPSGPPVTTGRPGLPGAPPRDTSAVPRVETGTGAVRGRIIGGDTGLPLRRVRVTLRALGAGEPRMTMSDTDGTFAFETLPAGRYHLSGAKPRYVDGQLGARRPGAPGRPFELADGQAFDNVVLTLAPAGVITGRVVDDTGEIMTGVTVMPMRYRTVNGERQLMPMGAPRQSDDTGTFRLFGLPPDTYYVSARADDFGRYLSALPDATVTGFAPTYYPGTGIASEAQPVEVVAGAEARADLSFIAARLTSISGFVVDAAGARATGGHIMTMLGGTGRRTWIGGGGGGTIKPDGTFNISGLAPGEYILQARPTFGANGMFEDMSSQRFDRVATASVAVNGEPIAGVRLTVVAPIRILVNATFDDPSAQPPARVFVSANSENGTGGRTAAIRDDGRLALEVVPGTYRLSASAGTPWYSETDLVSRTRGRSRRRRGRSDGRTGRARRRPVHDEDIGRHRWSDRGLREARGGLRRRDLPREDEARQRANFRRTRVARPDQQGRFRVEHLPPGDYLAAAVVDVDMQEVFEPDVLERLRRGAKPFRLREGDTATLSLTLAPVP